MRLLINKIKLSLLKRTNMAQTTKDYDWWKAKGYENAPTVTFIFQSHNKSLQICHILKKLRQYQGKIEIIVIDDGSSFEHTRRLVRELTGANEFLVRSNDLFEVVTYDKAMRMANGQYVALMQDDDDFDDTTWIDEAVNLFRAHPKMAVLGGKWGSGMSFEDGHPRRVEKIEEGDFCFVACVCCAPMWFNKSLFDRYLHHNDFEFAPVQYDDDEICLRSWTLGLQVGRYEARFKSLSAGGMRVWNKSLLAGQTERNGRWLARLYADRMDEITHRVAESNDSLR